MMKSLLILLTLLIGLLGFPSQASAHMVETDYSMLLSQFQFTTAFSTGEPFAEAPVQVYSPNDPETPWMEGTTDETGHFSFQPDPSMPGDWQIRIGERGDHADILTVPVSDHGIEFDQISQESYAAPHWWAQQLGVATAAFSAGVGAVLWLQRRRWMV